MSKNEQIINEGNIMNNEYPLYPDLTEHGEKEAQRVMNSFKPRIGALIEELMDSMYSDVSMHVKSDHWDNYRISLLDGFKGYDTKHHEYSFKELRQAIYKNNKEAIITDLNQDLVIENERLKEEIQRLNDLLTKK